MRKQAWIFLITLIYTGAFTSQSHAITELHVKKYSAPDPIEIYSQDTFQGISVQVSYKKIGLNDTDDKLAKLAALRQREALYNMLNSAEGKKLAKKLLKLSRDYKIEVLGVASKYLAFSISGHREWFIEPTGYIDEKGKLKRRGLDEQDSLKTFRKIVDEATTRKIVDEATTAKRQQRDGIVSLLDSPRSANSSEKNISSPKISTPTEPSSGSVRGHSPSF